MLSLYSPWIPYRTARKAEAQLAELCCAAYARLGQPSVGLRALRSCLKRARDLGERRIEGHLLLGAVRATEALGHAGALQSCSAALKIFEELDDRRAVTFSCLFHGVRHTSKRKWMEMVSFRRVLSSFHGRNRARTTGISVLWRHL